MATPTTPNSTVNAPNGGCHRRSVNSTAPSNKALAMSTPAMRRVSATSMM